MAAAVADFRPGAPAERKLERGDGLTLELEPTPDLLARGRAHRARPRQRGARRPTQALRPTPVLVGFAAETGSLDRAADKLRRKGVDLLVANDVAEAGSGFGTDTNRVSILAADGTRDDLPAAVQARRRRCGCSTASLARWTSATPPGRLDARPNPPGSQHERHDRHRRVA